MALNGAVRVRARDVVLEVVMLDYKNRWLMVLGAIAAAVAVAAVSLTRDVEPTVPLAALAATMADVEQRFPNIPHVSVAEVAEKMKGGNVVLFDVRQPEEYAVSHLPGAIQVAPGMTTRDFLSLHGDKVQGKDVVFYCSVGVRSSTLGVITAEALKARGATGVADMAGGIFAWHSESRPLENAKGPTDFLHPYSEGAKRMVVRSDLARMTVE